MRAILKKHMDFDRITAFDPAQAGTDNGRLNISGEMLTQLAACAFERLSFTFTHEHLAHLAAVACTESNSTQDRMVASMLLENAVISSKGVYPLCQDTGIANVFAWKDSGITTSGDDTTTLSAGIEKTYRERNLRFSTTIPSSLFEETDPGNNMPAQIMITAAGDTTSCETAERGPAYRFLFCAKGGGSSNKTYLTQATKAILTEKAFKEFLETRIRGLGTAACPPYSIAVVAGGLSPEQNLLALKLATMGYFDRSLTGWDYRVFGTSPIRDAEMEKAVLEIAEGTGLGAQFGGKALAVSARVLRLPRHGASCPVSIGVSCSAHRNLHGYIDRTGIWLERTEIDPLSVPGVMEALAGAKGLSGKAVKIDLDLGIDETRKALSGLKPGMPVLLSGKILVARDAAHARWRKLIVDGKQLPEYTTGYPIMYAGPAQTPEGCITGSIGPTTAGRMDEYADDLMSRVAALVTIAKGNRSEKWTSACSMYGATYLGTVGGAAALIASKYITGSELVDYADLGMEAVRLITVRNFPAFVVTNDRGEDLYEQLQEGHPWR